MDDTTTLLLNGEAADVRSPRSTKLLWVLREELGDVSPRFGCGQALCGACMVMVDGRPAHSCDVPLWSVEGHSVETLEGIARGEVGRALIEAFEEEQAAQCGYCIPGILVVAAALLRDEPHPSREQIATALQRNLCRCGTHVRILRAIARAATVLRGRTS
jgi:nicotinate dehydrogenase subunit A